MVAGIRIKNANRQTIIDQNYFNFRCTDIVISPSPVHTTTFATASGTSFGNTWYCYDVTSYVRNSVGITFAINIKKLSHTLVAFMQKAGNSLYIYSTSPVDRLFIFHAGGTYSPQSGAGIKIYKNNQVVFDSRLNYMNVAQAIRYTEPNTVNYTPQTFNITPSRSYAMTVGTLAWAQFMSGGEDAQGYWTSNDLGAQGIQFVYSNDSWQGQYGRTFDPWNSTLDWGLYKTQFYYDVNPGDIQMNKGGQFSCLILDVTNY